jgi:polyhydroxyalkanoate synthesis regulator phasin
MIHKTSRELNPQTSAILDFLIDHPYATRELVVAKLGFSKARVQSVFYHYGFTGSANAKKKYYTLWKYGDKIRQGWPKDLVSEAEAKANSEELSKKWIPKKKGPLPPPDQAKKLTDWVDSLEKQTSDKPPTKGQEIVREVIKTDTDELTRLRNEVTTLRCEMAYLERKLGIRNADAV